MRRQLMPAFVVTVALTLLLGVAYPLVTTLVAQGLFGHRANGSLVRRSGVVVGSSLIGQSFADSSGNPDPRYFQPRPSAAGNGYDPRASGGTNLGPSNPKLIAPANGPQCYIVGNSCYPDTVPGRIDAYRRFNGVPNETPIPVDAVTASASGLDPDISVANAQLQAPRVAAARRLSVARVANLIRTHTVDRPWGFLGENTVNVLDLNLALDAVT